MSMVLPTYQLDMFWLGCCVLCNEVKREYKTPRLGLILQSFLEVSEDNSTVNVNVFFTPCIWCDFFHSSLLTIRRSGKNQSYQDPFLRLNSVPPCGMWTQVYLILFYSQHLRTSQWFYVDKLSVLRKDVRRKNCNGTHEHSPTCFNAICFFCGKKSQSVALAWADISGCTINSRIKTNLTICFTLMDGLWGWGYYILCCSLVYT